MISSTHKLCSGIPRCSLFVIFWPVSLEVSFDSCASVTVPAFLSSWPILAFCNSTFAACAPPITAIFALGHATINRGSYALPHIADSFQRQSCFPHNHGENFGYNRMFIGIDQFGTILDNASVLRTGSSPYKACVTSWTKTRGMRFLIANHYINRAALYPRSRSRSRLRTAFLLTRF